MPTSKRHQTESERKKSADERGRLLREFRKVYDVTLEEMAQRVGLSQPMLTRFETGTRNLSADAWTRLFIAMGEIEKEKGAASKARFLRIFERPTTEAEDQSRLEVSKAMAVQLPKVQAVVKKKALAYIRKNPGRTLERYSSLVEWRQKLLDLEAQGYALFRKSDVEAKDQRIAELEQELKACQEELARERASAVAEAK